MITKLKRAVIREELVALTGDAVTALILGQMLYWSERTQDVDRYIAEESQRDPATSIQPTHGWIYKTAEELADEIMLGGSRSTISRRLVELVKAGWLQRRNNPAHKWDHTWQYRVDFHKVQSALQDLGYHLEGYKRLASIGPAQPTPQPDPLNEQNAPPNVQNAQTISETTPETTPEIYGSAPSASPSAHPLRKTPNPEQAQNPPKPPSEQALQNQKRKEIADHFASRTGLPVPAPRTATQQKAAGALWYAPLREMLELAGGDVPKAKRLIDDALTKLEGLTISDPNSILKTARAIAAEGIRGPSSDDREQIERVLREKERSEALARSLHLKEQQNAALRAQRLREQQSAHVGLDPV